MDVLTCLHANSHPVASIGCMHHVPDKKGNTFTEHPPCACRFWFPLLSDTESFVYREMCEHLFRDVSHAGDIRRLLDKHPKSARCS